MADADAGAEAIRVCSSYIHRHDTAITQEVGATLYTRW